MTHNPVEHDVIPQDRSSSGAPRWPWAASSGSSPSSGPPSPSWDGASMTLSPWGPAARWTTPEATGGDFFFFIECLQTWHEWRCNSHFFFLFLVTLNLQGLHYLHADPGGALPDLPSHHHAVLLRLHPQTLQEGPPPQGQCSMSASLFLKSQADTNPRCAEGLEILLLIG